MKLWKRSAVTVAMLASALAMPLSAHAITWAVSVNNLIWTPSPEYEVHTGGAPATNVDCEADFCYVSLDNGGGFQYWMSWQMYLYEEDWAGFDGTTVDQDVNVAAITPDMNGHWERKAHDSEGATLSGTVMREAGQTRRIRVWLAITGTVIATDVQRYASSNPSTISEYTIINP